MKTVEQILDEFCARKTPASAEEIRKTAMELRAAAVVEAALNLDGREIAKQVARDLPGILSKQGIPI